MIHHPMWIGAALLGLFGVIGSTLVALTYESNYAAHHDDLPVRVFMSVGGREEADNHLVDPSYQFVTNVKTLAKTLQGRGYPGLQLTTQVLEDETHFSVIPATFSRGLRVVFPLSVWERGRGDIRGG